MMFLMIILMPALPFEQREKRNMNFQMHLY